MAYDAVVKMLVDAEVRNFFRLLGVAEDRELTETEPGKPRVLRLDHVSKSRADGEILHIEFQATDADMRWRMLEYYSAVAAKHGFIESKNIKQIKQYVILVGRARQRANKLTRDNISFEFVVLRMDSLDPNRTLLKSPDAFEVVLGLLCIENVYDRDWIYALERIRMLHVINPCRAIDAMGLLVVIAEQLLDVNPTILAAIRSLAVEINIEESTILGELLARRDRASQETATRESLVYMLAMTGHEATDDDFSFMGHLDLDELKSIQEKIAQGTTWSEIVHRSPTLR